MQPKQPAKAILLLALMWTSLCTIAWAQLDSAQKLTSHLLDQVSTQNLAKIDQRYQQTGDHLTNYCTKALQKIQKQESLIINKLQKPDSLAASALLEKGKQQYNNLFQQLKDPAAKLGASSLKNYLPGLDSVQTMFKFLDKNSIKIPGIPADKLQAISTLNTQLKAVQAQLQAATNISQFIKERKQLLQESLDKFNMGDQMKRLKKQVYYYQEQVKTYKEQLNDPGKLALKALSIVKDMPAFKAFMAKNSQLAQLFNVSGSGGGTDPSQALPGLQTKESVQQQLDQASSGGGGGDQAIQQQMQAGQEQLNQLKDKINKLGGSSSDMTIPDFKPNNQKTKSFLKRLEYGLNVQSQRANALLPTTSDIAVTIGYKLNNKSVIGVGVGYKLGWGQNLSNIRLSNQGVSLRSFIDMKLKGSIWISGGYEENYQQEFSRINQLSNLDAWQKSGLIGLTKKYKIGKKGGNLQLLWDFLSYSQTPLTPALKFRIGYSF